MIKKAFLGLALLAGLGLNASAQGISARIEGGASMSSQAIGTFNNTLDGKLKLNYRAGAALEIPLGSIFYVSPGLVFKGGGTSFDLKGVLPEKNYEAVREWALQAGQKIGADELSAPSISSHAVSVPLTLGLRLRILKSLGLSLEAGPYLSYMLKEELTLGPAIGKFIEVSKQSASKLDFSHFDYGLGASVALEFSTLYIRGGVDVGSKDRKFLNLSTNSSATAPSVDASRGFELFNQLKAKEMNFYLTLGLSL